jgi:Domain of unknown function (DUF4157)
VQCCGIYVREVEFQEHGSAPRQLGDVRRRTSPSCEAATQLEDPTSSLTRLASSVGNRGFSRMIARMEGEGILAGGVVHPDIESAIASVSGGGRSLDAAIAEDVGSALGDPFSEVRVHSDDHAAALSRAVSARAFTVGRDIFFGEGEYEPGSARGRELLAHELAHVVQQRGGGQSGPLTVSEPGDALEREADAVSRGIG